MRKVLSWAVLVDIDPDGHGTVATGPGNPAAEADDDPTGSTDHQ